MSDMTDCQAELIAAQAEVTGLACEAIFPSQTVAAFIETNRTEDILAPDGGGIALAGAQVIRVTKALLTSFSDPVKYPTGEPPKQTRVTVRGNEYEVLNVTDADGILYITLGDFASK